MSSPIAIDDHGDVHHVDEETLARLTRGEEVVIELSNDEGSRKLRGLSSLRAGIVESDWDWSEGT